MMSRVFFSLCFVSLACFLSIGCGHVDDEINLSDEEVAELGGGVGGLGLRGYGSSCGGGWGRRRVKSRGIRIDTGGEVGKVDDAALHEERALLARGGANSIETEEEEALEQEIEMNGDVRQTVLFELSKKYKAAE